MPSLTEALFELGLGARVVGVTDWCVHPAAEVARAAARWAAPRIPSLARVLELRPDLVIANQEENRERDVERLRAAGVPVWVTYPRTVAEGVALVRELAELGAPPERARAAVSRARAARSSARAPRRPRGRTRVFCAIWKKPWMAVGADTYAHDLLALCGGAERVRRAQRAPLSDRRRRPRSRPRSPR